MIRKTIQAGAIALGLLGVSAVAGEGASFAAGGSFLMAKPAMSETGMGAGVNFDIHFPVKSIRGLELGMRSFLAQVTLNDYVNTEAGNYTKEDLDRDFYYAGVAFGPRFKSEGKMYFLGTAGLLVTANYATNITYADNNVPDRKVVSETADVSVGGEGSVGGGYRLGSGMTFELSLVAMGASSEDAPGVMFSFGPKFTFGMSL